MKKIPNTKLILILVALFCVTTSASASEYDINSFIGTADSLIGHSPSLINGDVLNIKQDLTATQVLGNLNAALTINGNNGVGGHYTINGASTYSGFNVNNTTNFNNLNISGFKNSGDGGAIYNQVSNTVTIANSTYGGANASDGNSANNGGAIFNFNCGNLNISADGSVGSGKTLFKNNTATTYGGAIYNQGNGIVNIAASKGGTVEFTDNTQGADGSKVDNAIYNNTAVTKVNLNAYSGGKIIFNDSIYGGIININKTSISTVYDGTISLIAPVQNAEVDFYNGTANINLDNSSLFFNAVNEAHLIDSTITNNSRILNLYSSGTVYLDNDTFTSNNFTNGNQAIYNTVTMYIADSTFRNNSSTSYGAIGNGSDGNLYINNSKFYDNSTSYCGGSLGNYGNLTLADSLFSGNHADTNSSSDGGAIYQGTGTSNISNTTFIKNTAALGYGGAIEINGGTVNITNSTFGGVNASDGNSANNGGAIDKYYSANLNIYADGSIGSGKTLFENNTATSYGGAIYSSGGTINIAAYKNGTVEFTDNTQGVDGAKVDNAIYNSDTVNLNAYSGGKIIFNDSIKFGTININPTTKSSVYDGTISINAPVQTATVNFYNGTAKIDLDNSRLYFKGVNETHLIDSLITNNTKVYNQDSNSYAYLDNDTFTSNNFTYGDHVINNSKTLYINNSKFYDNSSDSGGGAIYNSSYLTIADSLFSGNHEDIGSYYGGGAIYQNNGTSNISNTTFIKNTAAQGYGGAIDLDSGYLKVTNSTFGGVNASDGNSANYGGAISSNSSSGLQIYADGSVGSGKTLFENNTATTYGGAIYNKSSSSYIDIAAYKGGIVEFTGNTQGADGAKVDNAIYNSGYLYLNAYSGGKIIFNDSIYGGRVNINDPNTSTVYDGTISLIAPVQSATVNFYNGTAQVGLDNSILYFYGVDATHLINSIVTNNSFLYNQNPHANIPAYLDNDTFTSNISTYQSPITNSQPMYITDSTFSNNSGNKGGVIENSAPLYINNSNFCDNIMSNEGGAIYNQSNLTITDSVFSGNHAAKDYLYGGAIYSSYIGNQTIITNSTFGGKNTSDGNSAYQGGAIYNQSNLNIFADGSVSSGKTLFENNTATRQGGAIYNYIMYSSTINIAAYKGGTVEFTGNTQGADGAKVSSAIDNTNANGSPINLNSDTSSRIIFNDKNYSGTFNINRSDLKFADNTTIPYSGNVIFNENLSNATLNIYNGTLTLGEWNNTKLTNAAGTASSNEYLTNVILNLSGGVLNLANNNAQDTLRLSNLTSTPSAYLLFDADLANSKNDSITTSYASGQLSIGGVHMLSDGTNSYLILFKGATAPTLYSFNTYTNNYKYAFTPNHTAGIFDIARTEVDGLAQAISDSSASRSFSAMDTVIPTADLGTMAGTTLYLYGNGNNITANNTSGLTVGSGQILNIQNVGTVSGFSDYFFSNAGTVNIDANGANTTLSSGINLDGGTLNVTTENSAIVNFNEINATSGTINVNGNANFNNNISNIALNLHSGTSNVSNANFTNTDIALVSSTMNLSADTTSNTVDSSSSLSLNNSTLNVNTGSLGSVTFDNTISSNKIANVLNINSDSVLNSGNVIFNNTVNDLSMNLYGGTLTFGAAGSTLTSTYTNNVNLNLQAGTLNLENGLATDVLNVKDFTATSNTFLKFDANLATGKNDTINVSGTASGTVNIFHINILADSLHKSSTLNLFTGSGDFSNLILSAFNIYSDKYMYEFSQDSTHLGTYDYNKTSRGSLNAAVEDESAYRVFSAPVNTNAWYDLGDMAGANSTLDIFANGHSINGAGYAGINVASGQTLNIDEANSWNSFVSSSNGGAINNAGTLNVTNSTIKNNSAVNGGAIYNTGVATLVNTSLTNNNATTQGGAIYNTGTVNIIADGSNVSISGNTTGTSTKTSNAIYLELGSQLNLNASSANSITIGDKITTNSTPPTETTPPAEININKTGVKEPSNVDAPTNGTVNINNNVSGNINLYGGTLALGADNYLNNDTLNCYGGSINMINNAVGTMALGALNLGSATTNLAIDADLANSKIDTITANSISATTGKLNINNIHMISDAANKTTAVQLADANMRNYITMSANTASGPIYNYNISYDSLTGSTSFVSNKQSYSPTVMSTPVSAAAGTFLNQLNVYSETLGRAEVYMSLPQNDRILMRYNNKIASIEESPKVFSPLYTPEERGGAWFKQYTTFENIPLNNGPNVSNVGYGAIIGVDSPMYHLKHGYDGYVTAFTGYNGSHQNYDNIGVYQNGGNLGLTGVAYKGNFFAALSGTVGASNGNANTPYGVDNFTTLIAGIAGKVGYNIEMYGGRFILQPTYAMSYTFSNTFDYTTAAGTNVKSDPLNAIQISPGLKFIANLKDGWQPYLATDMVWNFMDSQKFYANDVQLPSVSVAPYIEYGLGVQRRWGERFSGYAQTMFRGGGRNGIALQFGFRWAL